MPTEQHCPLVVNNISVSFAGLSVLRQVSFTLATGEFCGLIGANGSGKTTLLRTILGFQSPDQGTVVIEQMPGRRGLPSFGYVPQKLSFDPELPLRARDLVALGLDGHRWGVSLPSRQRRRQIDEMLYAV